MADRQLILETRQLCKTFGPTRALDKVDLKVYRGEITGLMGENGSGKSTITSIIAGMQPPSEGEMFYEGQPHKPATMIEAAKAGIGMIVQEQGYVSGITVAQNIFLGNEDRFRNGPLISAGRMNAAAKKALEDIGYGDIDPASYIDSLNLQDRKLVEIARVMCEDPQLLIVDETTTSLSQRGREIIYGIMDRMRAENKAVIFITHDLQELMIACDTVTVLRDGKYIATLDKESMNAAEIKRLIVGRELSERYYRSDYGEAVPEEVVLEADNVTSASGLLMNFTLKAHKGEILGIGGLSHCGMHELGRVLFGAEKLLTGQVRHTASGKLVRDPSVSLKLGMGYVSKNRDMESLIPAASVRDNIAMAGLDKLKSFGLFILPRTEKSYARRQVEALRIKCASIEQNVQFLSGGNKQKVAFGKWLGRDCQILIFDCPTRGVDIGVKAAMYDLMHEMKRQGKTVIMISEELAELIGMCDRLLILKDGGLAGEFLRSPDLSEHQIVEIMI